VWFSPTSPRPIPRDCSYPTGRVINSTRSLMNSLTHLLPPLAPPPCNVVPPPLAPVAVADGQLPARILRRHAPGSPPPPLRPPFPPRPSPCPPCPPRESDARTPFPVDAEGGPPFRVGFDCRRRPPRGFGGRPHAVPAYAGASGPCGRQARGDAQGGKDPIMQQRTGRRREGTEEGGTALASGQVTGDRPPPPAVEAHTKGGPSLRVDREGRARVGPSVGTGDEG
jgi:hypothetical protein